MKLQDFLIEYNITQIGFSRLIGVCQSDISRYLKGERTPKVATQQRIAEVTGGLVSYSDWISCIKGSTYYEEIINRYKIPFSEISKILEISDLEFANLLKSDSFSDFQRIEIEKLLDRYDFPNYFEIHRKALKEAGKDVLGLKVIASLLKLSVSSVSMKQKYKSFNDDDIFKIKQFIAFCNKSSQKKINDYVRKL